MDELIWKQDAIDAMLGDKVQITNVIRAIGNERDFEVLNCTCDRHAEIIKALPPVQPEMTDEQFKDYCRKRCLSVVTNEFMYEVRKMVPSVQPNHNADASKMEIIHCKDCKFAHMTVDGECKYCDIWFPDEKTYMPGDYYCASAERRGEADEST